MVDEGKILEDSLERLKNIIVLTKEGAVHFLADRGNLSSRQVILLYLIGKRYAREANLIDVESLTLDQISKDLVLSPKVAAARLAELKNEGLVESKQRGHYGSSPFAAEAILSEIESSQPIVQTGEEAPPISAEGIPVIKPTKRTIANIELLLATPWGRTPRTASEIMRALEVNAVPDTPEKVRVYLGRLVSSAKLARIDKEGKFAYFKRPP